MATTCGRTKETDGDDGLQLGGVIMVLLAFHIKHFRVSGNKMDFSLAGHTANIDRGQNGCGALRVRRPRNQTVKLIP